MDCHLLRPNDKFSTTVSRFWRVACFWTSFGVTFQDLRANFSTTVLRFRRVACFWASFGAALGLSWAVLGLAKGGVGARWRLPWPPFYPPGVSLASLGSRLAPLGLLFGDRLVLFGACLRAQGGIGRRLAERGPRAPSCQGHRIRKNCKIDAPTIGAYM